MAEQQTPGPAPSNPRHWFPEFWRLSRRRLRAQARLLGLCLVVGVVAGVGAVVFNSACQVVFHYTLGAIAGYHPITPGHEPTFLPEIPGPFRWWWLLLI